MPSTVGPNQRSLEPLAAKISAAQTERVIHRFYQQLRQDVELGRFFAHIDDFSKHEKLIVAFWRTAMGERSATPAEVDMIGKHLPLSLKLADFERWLAIFERTLRRELTPELAAQWLQMAQAIGATLARRTGLTQSPERIKPK